MNTTLLIAFLQYVVCNKFIQNFQVLTGILANKKFKKKTEIHKINAKNTKMILVHQIKSESEVPYITCI